MVVLFPLQHHLRRVRRSGQLSLGLLPRSVSRQQSAGRRFHHRRGALRQLPAAGRRHAGRPRGRLPYAARAAHRDRGLPGRSRDAAAGDGGAGAAGRRDGDDGDGQRQRVPTRAAAIRGPGGHHYRHRGRGRRVRRVPAAFGAGRHQGWHGNFGLGFALLAFVALAGAAALLALGRVWRSQWDAESARRAGLCTGDQEFEEYAAAE